MRWWAGLGEDMFRFLEDKSKCNGSHWQHDVQESHHARMKPGVTWALSSALLGRCNLGSDLGSEIVYFFLDALAHHIHSE